MVDDRKKDGRILGSLWVRNLSWAPGLSCFAARPEAHMTARPEAQGQTGFWDRKRSQVHRGSRCDRGSQVHTGSEVHIGSQVHRGSGRHNWSLPARRILERAALRWGRVAGAPRLLPALRALLMSLMLPLTHLASPATLAATLFMTLPATFVVMSSSASAQMRTPGTGGFDPQCIARPETGIWAVKRPRNKQLSRLEVQIDCRNGLYLARAFVRCGRTECSWGYAQAVAEGELMQMVFEGFNALYYVTARYAGGAGLNVMVETRYRDAAKPSIRALYALERAN